MVESERLDITLRSYRRVIGELWGSRRRVPGESSESSGESWESSEIVIIEFYQSSRSDFRQRPQKESKDNSGKSSERVMEVF